MTDTPVVRQPEEPERFASPEDGPPARVGDWVWFHWTKERYVYGDDEYNHRQYDDDEEEIEPDEVREVQKKALGCVVEVGSNYVEIEYPLRWSNDRVHFDEFDECCRHEPEAARIIAAEQEALRLEAQRLLAEIHDVTVRLGLHQHTLGHHPDPSKETRALAVVGDAGRAMDEYKADLVRAKDEQLPALFSELKDVNETLAVWMTAPTIPLKAEAAGMKGTVKLVEKRIHGVSLYAGLAEDAVQVRKGKPASMGEKLHLMQSRCYMDEEAIVGYRAGGIEFTTIGKFDRWLGKLENLERILPYPRCAVAFRVRRHKKNRRWNGSISHILFLAEMAQLDEMTFLYVRNGKQLWRINTDIDFGSHLFPTEREFDFSKKRMFSQKFREFHFATEAEYEGMLEREAERKRLSQQWKKENPNENSFLNPHSRMERALEDKWEPFNDESVYFDNAMRQINDEIESYNRVCLVLQGLYDRSMVLHPHPRVQLWDPESFDQNVVLVRDGERTLHYGTPPSFEEYRHRCNESLEAGCVTFGQQTAFLVRESERENARMDRSWRTRTDFRYGEGHYYSPYGNPGPGKLAYVDDWKPRARKAVYRWQRERRTYDRWGPRGPLPDSITVPDTSLFNMDAYEAGDFKQFYEDPRTRCDYLRWANILLTAEDYAHGKVKVGQDSRDE